MHCISIKDQLSLIDSNEMISISFRSLINSGFFFILGTIHMQKGAFCQFVLSHLIIDYWLSIKTSESSLNMNMTQR